ncbi:hypothetical protein TL16_g09236 [Triparma laevis f. inornata]|uniref:Uncharacterized protein n=1 Tax=Triparma laevis f. inornata TaxID=1714386 RepID=A0A9W7EKX8_9STRA|nr:hypothetical protein TL16_g09236 [Triparma laevis f. inornata]
MPADVQALFDSLGDNLNSLNDLNEDRLSQLEYAKKMKAPQRIVDMLELLTVDEMKDCDDTEAAIQSAIDKKKATIAENKAAMENIVDYTAREKATVLQTQMFGELEAADANAAHATFDQLKACCGDQAKRLGDLIATVMDKYKTTDAKRYAPFEEVRDIKVKEQTPPPALPLEDQVKFQLAKATWYEEGFNAAMDEIAAVFNSAKSCEEICEHYDIDNGDGKWEKELRAEAFNLDLGTGEVIKVKFGPPKGFPRALEKLAQGKTLRDLNRVTFEFEDPLLMALCFEVLNKRDILLIKKELHKFYDVNRADGPFVVAGRLFKSLSDPDEKQRDEDSKYRSMDFSTTTTNPNPLLTALKQKDLLLALKDSELSSAKAEIEELKKQQQSHAPPPPTLVKQVMSPGERRSIRRSISQKKREEEG